MLKVENVFCKYGEVQVLKDINLEINKGQIYAVIGSNGAGKSTLINTISGIIRPFKGQITFEDKTITNLPPHKIADMGISQIPEGRQLFTTMSVLENLLEGASCRRAKKEEIAKSIERVFEWFPRLKARKDQKAGSLSGGEQQMLAIGRGLMSLPKLLILDELSLGLSPLLTQEIFKVLSALNKEGLTIMIVDQNLVLSLRASNYGYVLENGRVVMQGTSSDLLANEQTKKAYLGLK